MANEYEITQGAIERLKQFWSLVAFKGSIYGLAAKKDSERLAMIGRFAAGNRDYILNTANNYIDKYCRFVGYILEKSSNVLNSSFLLCCYSALNNNENKVRISFSKGYRDRNIPFIPDTPNIRTVLMAKEEATELEKITDKHGTGIPGYTFIEIDKNKIEDTIPKNNISVPDFGSVPSGYDAEFEKRAGAFLRGLGVDVNAADNVDVE